MPLRFNSAGQPEPLGVRAAAVKMGLIVAQEDKGAEKLTPEETRAVTVACEYLGSEYERVADSNERLMRELARKDTDIAALLERIREADGAEEGAE